MAKAPKKQTSAAVSGVASAVMRKEPVMPELAVPAHFYNELLRDAKTLAGSALSQDETKGQS